MEKIDVLIVDDEKYIRDILSQFLNKDGYTFDTASNGLEALEKLSRNEFKLVISDIMMEVKDGMELLADIQKRYPDVAVIMITGFAEIKGVVEAMRMGAYDFIEKPLNYYKLLISVEQALEKRDMIIELRKYRQDLEKQVREKTQALRENYLATLDVLISTLGFHDPETGGHCHRVADYSRLLAQRMGVDEEEIVHLERGALLHDIGKVGIHDAVINKPGGLSDEEWKEMRQHPLIGYELLSKHSFLEEAAYVALYHHEYYDGSGYLKGLAGDEIPIKARIFTMIDAFDVITSNRPYSKAKSIKDAREELEKCAGSHFDPKVVKVFNNEITDEELIEIRKRVDKVVKR